MRNRYTARLWKRTDPYEPSHFLVCERSFKTADRARRQCERWLERHPVVTTRYCVRRDMNRAPFADTLDARGVHRREFIEPEWIEAPSVGDLGVTP